MSDTLEADISHVRQQLAQVRKQRMAEQRQAADHATVAMALERTSRDRSALSSPTVETERERVQKLYDELITLYGSVDHLRILLSRVKTTGAHPDTRRLEDLLAAEAAHRDTLAADGIAGGARG